MSSLPENLRVMSGSGKMPENIVIFGASGFVGRNLLTALKGYRGRLVGISMRPFKFAGVECVQIQNLESLRLAGETVVVHLAAHRYDAAAFKQAQSEILQFNVAIHNAVYRFALTHDIAEVRMVSSMAVYSEGQVDLDDAVPLDFNTDPAVSERMYGWSKRIGEIYARLHSVQYGIRTVIFRLTNPYGPYDSLDEQKAHVMPAFILRALREPSGPFVVRGSPEVSRDFICIRDVCAVLETSLSWKGREGTYNLASGSRTTIGELAKAVLRELGQDREVRSAGEGVSSVAHRSCRVERLKRDFGIASFVPLDIGLHETVEWYKHELRKR